MRRKLGMRGRNASFSAALNWADAYLMAEYEELLDYADSLGIEDYFLAARGCGEGQFHSRVRFNRGAAVISHKRS